MLDELGLETSLMKVARLEASGQTASAAALRSWINRDIKALKAILRALSPTKSGTGRDVRVANCGLAFLARTADGHLGWKKRSCKDRLCPDCGPRRRRMFTARLREVSKNMCGLAFVTLTRLKGREEEPRWVLRELLRSFTKLVREGKKRGWLLGGVRSTEVTARAGGTWVNGHRVQYTGIHAHLHCIFQLRCTGDAIRSCGRRGERGSSARYYPNRHKGVIVEAWKAACPGAGTSGQDVQPLTAENCYQVGSYVLDMSGLFDCLTAAPAYCRKVLEALSGARLVAALGGWKGRDPGLLPRKRDTPALVYGDCSLWTASTEAERHTVRFGDLVMERDYVLANLRREEL